MFDCLPRGNGGRWIAGLAAGLTASTALVLAGGPTQAAAPSASAVPTVHATLTAATSTAAPAPRPALVAVVGKNHALWVRPLAGGTFTSLGGGIAAPPAVVTTTGDTYYVAEGSNRTLYIRGVRQGWRRLSTTGLACRQPGAAVQGTTLTVVCLGNDGTLREGSTKIVPTVVPSIAKWVNLGGSFSTGPAVGVVAGKTMVAATKRVTAGLAPVMTRPAVGGVWSTTHLMCTGQPALTAVGVSGLNAVLGCNGAGGSLWYLSRYTGGVGPSAVSAGGRFVGPAGLTHTADGTTVGVGVNSANSVFERSLAYGQTWHALAGTGVAGAGAGQLDAGDQACAAEIGGARSSTNAVATVGDYAYSINGSGTRQLTKLGPSQADGPVLSPDDSTLAYRAPGPARVDGFHFDWTYVCMVHAADLRGAHAVLLSADGARTMQWTPDSKQLVTQGVAPDNPYGSQQNFSAAWDRTSSVLWPTCDCIPEDVRADGTWLLNNHTTESWLGDSTILYEAKPGETPVQILSSQPGITRAIWSPDGTTFAYWVGLNLHTANADGSGAAYVWLASDQGLTTASIRSMNWSPDGTTIAASIGVWLPGQQPSEETWVIALGGGTSRLIEASADGGGNAWSHDGSMIATESGDGYAKSTLSILDTSTWKPIRTIAVTSPAGICTHTGLWADRAFSGDDSTALLSIYETCRPTHY